MFNLSDIDLLQSNMLLIVTAITIPIKLLFIQIHIFILRRTTLVLLFVKYHKKSVKHQKQDKRILNSEEYVHVGVDSILKQQ